jgi:hypothetical protein
MAALIAVPAGIGYPLLFAFVAAESAGALVPGETSLIVAAALASQGKLSFPLVVVVAAGAAIVGDNIGYLIGRRRLRRLVDRPGRWAAGRRQLIERGRSSSLAAARRPSSSGGGCPGCEGRHVLARRCRTDAVAAFPALERAGRDRLGVHDRRARLRSRPKRVGLVGCHRLHRNRRRRSRLRDHARPPLAFGLSEATGRPTASLRRSRPAVISVSLERMPKSIDHTEVRRLVSEEDAQLVEVLPAKEFSEEHITGAINIPLKELDRRAPVELERERPVIVYCNDYQ